MSKRTTLPVAASLLLLATTSQRSSAELLYTENFNTNGDGIRYTTRGTGVVLLTVEGTTEKYLYFVLEGVQRAYSVSNEGREATLVFTYPYSFSGVADSFLLQQPSRYFLETLTPSVFLMRW